MRRDKRVKRDIHALDQDGMILCNSRDKEAAHRAEMGKAITSDKPTCKKCLSLLRVFKESFGGLDADSESE